MKGRIGYQFMLRNLSRGQTLRVESTLYTSLMCGEEMRDTCCSNDGPSATSFTKISLESRR